MANENANDSTEEKAEAPRPEARILRGVEPREKFVAKDQSGAKRTIFSLPPPLAVVTQPTAIDKRNPGTIYTDFADVKAAITETRTAFKASLPGADAQKETIHNNLHPASSSQDFDKLYNSLQNNLKNLAESPKYVRNPEGAYKAAMTVRDNAMRSLSEIHGKEDTALGTLRLSETDAKGVKQALQKKQNEERKALETSLGEMVTLFAQRAADHQAQAYFLSVKADNPQLNLKVENADPLRPSVVSGTSTSKISLETPMGVPFNIKVGNLTVRITDEGNSIFIDSSKLVTMRQMLTGSQKDDLRKVAREMVKYCVYQKGWDTIKIPEGSKLFHQYLWLEAKLMGVNAEFKSGEPSVETREILGRALKEREAVSQMSAAQGTGVSSNAPLYIADEKLREISVAAMNGEQAQDKLLMHEGNIPTRVARLPVNTIEEITRSINQDTSQLAVLADVSNNLSTLVESNKTILDNQDALLNDDQKVTVYASKSGKAHQAGQYDPEGLVNQAINAVQNILPGATVLPGTEKKSVSPEELPVEQAQVAKSVYKSAHIDSMQTSLSKAQTLLTELTSSHVVDQMREQHNARMDKFLEILVTKGFGTDKQSAMGDLQAGSRNLNNPVTARNPAPSAEEIRSLQELGKKLTNFGATLTDINTRLDTTVQAKSTVDNQFNLFVRNAATPSTPSH